MVSMTFAQHIARTVVPIYHVTHISHCIIGWICMTIPEVTEFAIVEFFRARSQRTERETLCTVFCLLFIYNDYNIASFVLQRPFLSSQGKEQENTPS